MIFMHILWVNSGKSNKITRIRNLYILKCYIQDASRTKQYHYFLRGTPKISRMNAFYVKTLGKQWQIKSNNQSQDTLHFENAIYSVVHERSNITASFAERLEVQENLTFKHTLWINTGKSKQKNWNQDNIHFELLYTWCSTKQTISLLLSRSIQNFKKT